MDPDNGSAQSLEVGKKVAEQSVQTPINSQTLLIQELITPVSIGLEAKMIGKNRQKRLLAAVARRKLSLRACKS